MDKNKTQKGLLIDFLTLKEVSDYNESYQEGFKRGCKETAKFIFNQCKKTVENTKYIVGGAEYLHIDVLEFLVKEIVGED